MDFTSLPRHPGQPANRPSDGLPELDRSVIWLRIGQLVVLLVVAALLGWVWWLMFCPFGGGIGVGPLFA